MTKRRLVAALACRNQGARLYGKPLQNLDVGRGIRIIDNIIDCLRSEPAIDEIILGISEGPENEVFKSYASGRGLRFVVGDETDVLSRLIACGRLGSATDVFRVTTESPFLYFEAVAALWKRHVDQGFDATLVGDVIDGCGFEILSQAALERSHAEGDSRHRSELCSLYIREHRDLFRIAPGSSPQELIRPDLRLTVDNPEDLILCRRVYAAFAHLAPRIPVADIVRFLDANPDLIALTAPYAETGANAKRVA